MNADITPEVDLRLRRWSEGPFSQPQRIHSLWLLIDDPIEIAEQASLEWIDLNEQLRALREVLRAALALLHQQDRTIDELRERLSCRPS